MNLCFIICGLPRCIELTLYNIENKFSNYNINYYIGLTKNYIEYEKEYVNDFNFENIINNKNIKKILFIEDTNDNQYRNSLNYIKKISNTLEIVEDKYDLYILIRSDLSFENSNFINLIDGTNKLYFSDNNFNSFIKNNNQRINDNIIITKNYNLLKNTVINIQNNLLKSNNYIEIALYEYIENNKIGYSLIGIGYKLILSNCNIIAIAGDSGSGKTTLSNYLLNIFGDNNYCKIETDRYHKWERGDPNYQKYSHLNPTANHLEKMNEDIYKLKIGHEIYSVDYDHHTGKFTQEEKIVSKNNVILCGLHTLYNDNTNNILDIKIFLDTDRELIKKWKIKRDVEERGYSIEKVLKQIAIRESDYNEYIKNQKDNGDIIIKFYELDNELKCELELNKKLSTYENYINLSNNYFNLENKDNLIKIKLKNNTNYIKYKIEKLPNNFYGEICLFLNIIIYNIKI